MSSVNVIQEKYDLIEQAYRTLCPQLVGFIARRVGDDDTARDLCQEVFVRALENNLFNRETIVSYLYTIARHLTTDHLRRRARYVAVERYFSRCVPQSVSMMSEVVTRDLARVEQCKLRAMPVVRSKVYSLSRYEDKDSLAIATLLGISKRTVDSHLFLARKEIRQFMSQCI
jgi:RNA polymerase sigma-70 factor (ECF subfamily)